MDFAKIHDSGKRITMRWTAPGAGGRGKIDHEFECEDRPHQAFTDALQAFREFVKRLLEVRADWMAGVQITGVTISTHAKTGRRGVVITAVRPVSDANSPFNIATPHLQEPSDESESTASGAGIWLSGMDAALKALEEEAALYLSGTRELQFEAESPEGNGTAPGRGRRAAVAAAEG